MTKIFWTAESYHKRNAERAAKNIFQILTRQLETLTEEIGQKVSVIR